MNTPVFDFVKKYSADGFVRAHMPGHKGVCLLGCENFDITEFDGADVLYHANGIIKESMDNASKLFGSGKTLYSAEGSSLSVRAMMYLIVLYAKKNGKSALVLALRNAHKVFVMSSALLDFEIEWLYGEDAGVVSCNITPEVLEKELLQRVSDKKEMPTAIYITSPDYLGNIADIKGISEVCEKYGILLAVDNAHGAYLGFLPENKHPMNLGAHICCDSAHKTLPGLTGSGYLHISKNAPQIFFESSEKAMMLFASTSPSYLILQSLDLLNKYISDGYKEKLSNYCEKVSELKNRLSEKGFDSISSEPLKITFTPKEYGYTGAELVGHLKEWGIVCEFYDPDYTVLMLTPENGDAALEKIYEAMCALTKKEKITALPPKTPRLKRAVSIREAVMAETEKVPVSESIGKVYAGICASCPPAIPIAVCGEVIDETAVKCLEYYGETRVECFEQ